MNLLREVAVKRDALILEAREDPGRQGGRAAHAPALPPAATV